MKIKQSNLVFANQIHSAYITIVNKAGLYHNTDALITNIPNLFLVISIADCAAVMIYDHVTKTIANIHSGWKGTLKNISGNTISKMVKYFGVNPKDLIVFVSPSISKKNFVVDEDVARLFPKTYIQRKRNSLNKYLIDLKKIIYDSLIYEGVSDLNIEISQACTFESPYLHSYRRDKTQSGRMFAVIGLL